MVFKNANYIHKRRKHPSTIDVNSYYTVPITHTNATGRYPKGTLARIGRSLETGNMVIQSVLIPKKGKKAMANKKKRKEKKLDIHGRPVTDYRGKKWNGRLGRYVYT